MLRQEGEMQANEEILPSLAIELRDRFIGDAGAGRLVQAFADLGLVSGDLKLAEQLAAASSVVVLAPGQCVITQGDADSDLYLILAGSVLIERNTRAGPIRTAGSHVGEMSLVDVHAVRSATVRCREWTVFARIPEQKFSNIASSFPSLWRGLAIEMSRRLRQRLEAVPIKNDPPKVFIGSASESLEVAKAVQSAIANERLEIKVWTDRVFGASQTTIESLEKAVRKSDFAVLVLSSDDVVRSRGRTHSVPRDNVIFELGLFMGALGRERAFALKPTQRNSFFSRMLGGHRSELKLPSDLLGVTTLGYSTDAAIKLNDRLKDACDELSMAIARLGAK